MKFEIFREYISSFVDLPDHVWFALAEKLNHRTLRREEFFFSPHNRSSEIAFVLSGVLKTYFISEDGQERITELCTAGTVTASYSIINPGITAEYYTQAVKTTELLSIAEADFTELMNHYPILDQFRTCQIELYYKEKLEREQILLSTTGAERLRWFYRTRTDIRDQIPQYVTASYLGLTPEALSRIKKEI